MKRILILMVCCVALTVQAQDTHNESLPPSGRQSAAFHFGYLSYDGALMAMPDYTTVQHSLSDLRRKYESEMSRVEKEFNKKYEAIYLIIIGFVVRATLV